MQSIKQLKVSGPISQNGKFYSNDSDTSSPKIACIQISFISVKPFGHKKRLRILQLPIPYCVSLKFEKNLKQSDQAPLINTLSML